MMEHTLRSIGLDKADENELQAARRSLTQQQQHAAKDLGEKLSFTREQWREEAAYLEDIFLRSIRCSKLRKYVDHDGHVSVIKRSQNVIKKYKLSANWQYGDEYEDGAGESSWKAAMLQRVSFLLSYLTELQRAAERMQLYDEDNELLLSITQCLDSIARLQSCFCRLKERGNPSVTDHDVQDDGASSFALAECISAVSVEE
jgi:hypothetical protein